MRLGSFESRGICWRPCGSTRAALVQELCIAFFVHGSAVVIRVRGFERHSLPANAASEEDVLRHKASSLSPKERICLYAGARTAQNKNN